MSGVPGQEYVHKAVRTPGGATPILHGLRVVELAEVIAAPSCGCILAQLGAEVVKVESPAGDMMRKFFLQFERRKSATCFESVNVNKASIVLDLKKKDDFTSLLTMLDGADVFITNVRPRSLRSLGLDYETLATRCPRLIYAHLTGWGRDGPESDLPGYDLGSFWSMSGMAAILHLEGLHQHMTVGFGDTATGLSMTSGVLLALTSRLSTGKGQLIDASLLRTGYFCMSKYLCNTDNLEIEDVPFSKSVPDYKGQNAKYSEKFGDALYDIYESKDKVSFALLGVCMDQTEYFRRAQALATWLEVPNVNSSAGRGQVRSQLKTKDYSEIAQGLESISVPYCRSYNLLEHFDDKTAEFYEKQAGRNPLVGPRCSFLPLAVKSAKCFAVLPAVTEADPSIHRLVNTPFRCHSSPEHGIQHAAPQLGEHTASFLQKLWSPRVPDLDTIFEGDPKGLSGMLVVELSDWGSAVASACMQLQDYGAQVIQVVTSQGDFWSRHDPAFYNQLNKGKQVVELDLQTSAGIGALLDLLSRATAFVTNWPVPVLEDFGLDHASVRSKLPALIYVLTVPFAVSLFGEGSLELEREMHSKQGTIGAQWLCSGLGSYLGGTDRMPRLPPREMLDQMASFSVLAGTSAALFHKRRTGEGQFVDVSLLRAGLYTLAANYLMMQHDPIKMDFFGGMGLVERRLRWPNPVTLSYRTKDGVWLQMLGVEMTRHLVPTMKVFGLRAYVAIRAIPPALKFLLKPKHPSGTPLFSMYPLLEIINSGFVSFVEALTWEQVKTLFDANNIWYVPILTPDLAVRNRQARATRLFQFWDSNGQRQFRLCAPTQLHYSSIRSAL